jgi:hypothetical protein
MTDPLVYKDNPDYFIGKVVPPAIKFAMKGALRSI